MKATDSAHVSGMFDDRERGVFVPLDRVHALSGWTQAIVYSQLAYWHQKMRRPFYKTIDNLAEELALSKRTTERALSKLRELGVIETVVKKVKGTPTNHFTVNYHRHDELVLSVRRSRSDSAKMAETMDSAKMAETYTGEYLQESTPQASPSGKPLSANADFGEKSKPSAKKNRPAPQASPSVPTPPVPLAPPFDEQVAALMDAYNSERVSPKGSLTEARGRSKARDAAARAYLKDMKRNGYEPVEMMRTLTRYLSRNDYYLGKKNDPRRGFETVLRNWSKYHEDAIQQAAKTRAVPQFSPGQKLWHKGPWMREREAVTVDRSRVGGKLMVYRGDDMTGPMIVVDVAHVTPRDET